jgi:lipopolysaccharide export LptBFGC system permease protein LptF
MVLVKYFFKRFFKYVFAIGLFLAFLINFIEFFEKIVHVRQAGINTIFAFVFLNLTPSFFELLGISAWLATCLLIKEFFQQNEWEAFSLLSVNYSVIFKMFLNASLCLMLFAFVLKEAFVEHLIFYSEQYKMEKFKQKPAQKVLGKWIMLNKDKIAYFGVLDLAGNTGTDLLIVSLNPDFTIEKALAAKNFYINPEKKSLEIASGLEFNIETNVPEKVENLQLISPTLFSQIKINLEAPTILNIYKNLLNRNILPEKVRDELIYNLLNRLIFYLKLSLFPVLTFMLFMFFWNTLFVKWVVLFVPYALFTVVSLLSDFLFSRGISPFLIMLIYLFILLGMFILHRRNLSSC